VEAPEGTMAPNERVNKTAISGRVTGVNEVGTRATACIASQCPRSTAQLSAAGYQGPLTVKASLGDNVNLDSGVSTAVVDGACVNLGDGHVAGGIGLVSGWRGATMKEEEVKKL